MSGPGEAQTEPLKSSASLRSDLMRWEQSVINGAELIPPRRRRQSRRTPVVNDDRPTEALPRSAAASSNVWAPTDPNARILRRWRNLATVCFVRAHGGNVGFIICLASGGSWTWMQSDLI